MSIGSGTNGKQPDALRRIPDVLVIVAHPQRSGRAIGAWLSCCPRPAERVPMPVTHEAGRRDRNGCCAAVGCKA